MIKLTGTRKEESVNRRNRLIKLGAPDALEPENKRKHVDLFYPIADVNALELWAYLERKKQFVCGEKINELKEVYKTGSQRDGCWICTVCAESSASQIFCSPFQHKIRRYLRAIKDDVTKRYLCKRENHKERVLKGLPSGYFSLEARQEMLDFIQACEKEEGVRYISDEEVKIIHELWGVDPKDYCWGF